MFNFFRPKSRTTQSSRCYIGRLRPLRVRRDARPHSVEDLRAMAPAMLPGIIIDDAGYVIAGFAAAHDLNRSWRGKRVRVFQRSSLNDAFLGNFVQLTRDAAARHQWPERMITVELQYLSTAVGAAQGAKSA